MTSCMLDFYSAVVEEIFQFLYLKQQHHNVEVLLHTSIVMHFIHFFYLYCQY